MKLVVYAIYDSKMEVFSPPYVMANRATALRVFGDMCQDPQFPYSRHPKDYFVFEIGTYDDHSGIIESQKPVNIGMLPSGKEEEVKPSANGVQNAEVVS